MKVSEYASYDATGLAGLVARREVSPTEIARTAAEAIAALNPKINAVIELYADRIDTLAESSLRPGPFHGVPFLIKDIAGHLDGRKVEFGSRLCEGLTTTDGDTNLGRLFQEAGLNIIGRSNTPEYSMSGTTENALYGNTSTPWREGYSAGGSTGGGAAAVAAGMVPMAHGSDIAGSIRIPAALCGGVGLKPSRGRVSVGPKIDEGGWGLAANFAQTKSIRDTALLLDCMSVPQPGDPFVIKKPTETYVTMIGWAAPRLKIGWSTKPLNDRPVDPEIAEAVQRTAKVLSSLGHIVEEDHPDYDGEDAAQRMLDVWFFDFPKRIHDLAAKTKRKPGPDTLEPVTLAIYEYAKTITTDRFLAAHASLNTMRRRLGPYFQRHDLWLSPTTAAVAEPWGHYNLGRTDLSPQAYMAHIFRQIQFCFPHNVMGTPAISLPLAMHSTGFPIGVQLGARPGEEHLVLQVAAQLEREMGWAQRKRRWRRNEESMKSNNLEARGRWRAFILAGAGLLGACQSKYEGASVSRFDNYASGPYSYSIFVKLDFYGQDPRAKAEEIMHVACPQDSPVLLDAQATQISGTSNSKTFLIAYFTCKQLIPGAE